jgi:arsenate reductase
MAEGLLRHLYGDRYEVFSAGATPTLVNPSAIKVMAEMGIDISKHRSKSIEEFRGENIDLVVSVCESSVRVICPFCASPIVGDRPQIIREKLLGAKRYLHRPFTDPSEVEGGDMDKLAAFRRTRDDIRKWILDYFASLKNS